MNQEKTEEQIQNLLVAVKGLEVAQEGSIEAQKTTTDNINKLTESMQSMSDTDTRIKSSNKRIGDLEDEAKLGIRPQTLKQMLQAAAIALITYCTYITLEVHKMDKHVDTLEATRIIEIKAMQEDIQSNKNQITYLKGAKQNKKQ